MSARTRLGQDNRDRTTVAGQPAQESRGRIVKTGDSWDMSAWTAGLKKSAWTGQSREVDLTDKPGQVNQVKTERTGWAEHNRKDRAARTGQLGQDSRKRDRTIRT
jgi:hypothetical protein